MSTPLSPNEVLWPSMVRTLKQQLFTAVDAVDLAAVEKILKKYPEAARWKNEDEKQTPLIVAATVTKDPKLVLLVLKFAPDAVNDANATGSSALMFAATTGDVPMLKLLDHADADLEHCNNNGVNALMSAAIKSQFQVVKYLSDAGVDLGRKNNLGQTAADAARLAKDENLAHALEKKEIEQRQARIDFFRAIDSGDAAPHAHSQSSLASAFNAAGQGNAEAPQESRSAPLAAALQGAIIDDILARHPSAARWRDPDGLTGLMRAAKAGNAVAAEKLIVAAPDQIDAINKGGSTAFLYAAFYGQVAVLEKLKEAGADTLHKNATMKNALMLATAGAQMPAVNWLLALPTAKRLSPSDADAQGYTALDYSKLDKIIQP